MRRILPFGALAVLLGASSVRAEDFSGFYAGMNAGYASGSERNARPSFASPSGDAPTRAGELPPSAAGATKDLQPARRAERPQAR
ncbi:hypothetical protein [uncultured Methylobacterium sp.]|uniref:hypothetical protein n=1 Tax=uncultured Methylobacterium sp. TaxID=157278 RepID=UPI0035CBD276